MRARHLMFFALMASANLLLADEPPAPGVAPGSSASAPTVAPVAAYDAELVKRVGADERGMRKYVLVILKTGPTPVPKGPERDAMFAGHFANITRMAKEGKLAVAGPFGKDPAGWRGLYIFAVDDIAAARALTETDPVIVKGEMIAEYHEWYGSAATMLIPEWHDRLVPPKPAPAAESDRTSKPAAESSTRR